MKHVYERNVEELRAHLSHFTDRGKHSNEKEYQALIAAWESYVAAYNATCAIGGIWSRHPDLNQMGEDELDEYLEGSDIDPSGRRLIKKAEDKKAALDRVQTARILNHAQRLIWEAHNTIRKQSVFIPIEIEEKFVESLLTLNKVWAENYGNVDLFNPPLLDETGDFLKNRDQMKAALRDIVRERVLRELPAAPDSTHA